jgi:hypothetical protein
MSMVSDTILQVQIKHFYKSMDQTQQQKNLTDFVRVELNDIIQFEHQVQCDAN